MPNCITCGINISQQPSKTGRCIPCYNKYLDTIHTFIDSIKKFSVYILELEDSCFYVGVTRNFKHRMSNHFNGTGAEWTKRHRPKRVVDCIEVLNEKYAKELERLATLFYANEFGSKYVRGYCWSGYNSIPPKEDIITNENVKLFREMGLNIPEYSYIDND